MSMVDACDWKALWVIELKSTVVASCMSVMNSTCLVEDQDR